MRYYWYIYILCMQYVCNMYVICIIYVLYMYYIYIYILLGNEKRTCVENKLGQAVNVIGFPPAGHGMKLSHHQPFLFCGRTWHSYWNVPLGMYPWISHVWNMKLFQNTINMSGRRMGFARTAAPFWWARSCSWMSLFDVQNSFCLEHVRFAIIE